MYLDRNGQREYLREKHGVDLAESALENKASKGTGPQYVIINGRALSKPEWLDEWVRELASTPIRQADERTSSKRIKRANEHTPRVDPGARRKTARRAA